MKSIKKSLNFVFYTFLIFIVISIWLTFYLKNKAFALFLSLIISIFACLFLEHIFKKTDKENEQKIQNKKEFDTFKIYLTSLERENFNSFIMKIFGNKISIIQNLPILNQNTLLINCLNEPLNKNKIIIFCATAKSLKLNKIAIFCTNNDEKNVLFAKSISNFQIEIISSEKLFELTKNQNISYENIITFKNKNKVNLKNVFYLIFARKNAKKFVFFGILSFMISFLTIFKFYYYIITTMFVIFSLICFFKPKQQTSIGLLD